MLASVTDEPSHLPETTDHRDPRQSSERTLIESGGKWIREALTAWAEDDHDKVALIAPLGVEFLGKAALWRQNPVLLVIMHQNDEDSLIQLATKPDLAGEGLKTIGLGTLLSRLIKVLGSLPISETHRKRLVNVRNGAVHVGAGDESRYVLLDCLSIMNTLLEVLHIEQDDFYQGHGEAVTSLLDERRSEIAREVARKLTKARMRLSGLKTSLPGPAFEAAVSELEAQRLSLDANDFGQYSNEGTDATCPVCESQGRLYGEVSIEAGMDWDVEPFGGGQYMQVENPYWDIALVPEVFYCRVCQLQLDRPEELGEAGLPNESLAVDEDDLGPDFNVTNYIGEDDHR